MNIHLNLPTPHHPIRWTAAVVLAFSALVINAPQSIGEAPAPSVSVAPHADRGGQVCVVCVNVNR